MVTEAELIAHVRSHIARFKSPECIEFLATPLPRTGSGKVQKFDLREKEWADTSAGSRASDGPANGAGQIARAARALREGLAKQRILWSPPAPPE